MKLCEITGSAKSMAGHGSKIKTNCLDQSLPCGGILGDSTGTHPKRPCHVLFNYRLDSSQSTTEKRCVFSFAFLLWSFFAELGRTLRSPELILCFAQVVMVTIKKNEYDASISWMKQMDEVKTIA